MKLHDFREALEALDGSAPGLVLSASFDLRPGTTGQPTASTILREAIRLDAEAADWGEDRVESFRTQLTEAIGAAIASGAPGLFVAGPVEEPTRLQAPAVLPPRHTLEISARPARFELERQLAMMRPSVASVWAERGSVQAVLVRADGEPLLTQIEADPEYMERSPGRTGQHGRGGSVRMPAGGHGKMRIEDQAEEERDRFAREAAALLERKLDDPEVIIVHGPPEFGARLISELAPRLRDRIVSDDEPRDRPEAREQAREAHDRAADVQLERARELHDQIVSGALPDALSGPQALRGAVRDGRLDALVLDEDAVGHFGDAVDARRHEPTRDAAQFRDLLAAALAQGARCWFAPSAMMDDAGGAVGTLRW